MVTAHVDQWKHWILILCIQLMIKFSLKLIYLFIYSKLHNIPHKKTFVLFFKVLTFFLKYIALIIQTLLYQILKYSILDWYKINIYTCSFSSCIEQRRWLMSFCSDIIRVRGKTLTFFYYHLITDCL